MVTIAGVGCVVALVGTAMAWYLVGQLHDTVDESLLVTNESVATLEETIVLVDEVVDDLSAGLGTLDDTLATLEQGFGDARPLVDDVGQLSSDVPTALNQLQRTLGRVGSAAGEIDAVLRQLSNLPFGPDFEPETSLSAQIDTLSRDLDPVIDTLESSSQDLEQLSASIEDLQAGIAALAADVSAVNDNLEGSSDLVSQYREQVVRAGDLATDSRQDLASNVRVMRVLIVIGGLLFAASQFVPLWVGTELLSSVPDGSGDSGGS